MADTAGGLVESVVGLVTRFLDIATASPEQGLLIAVGAALTTLSVVVAGYLAAGAAAEAVASLIPSGRAPPRRDR